MIFNLSLKLSLNLGDLSLENSLINVDNCSLIRQLLELRFIGWINGGTGSKQKSYICLNA